MGKSVRESARRAFAGMLTAGLLLGTGVIPDVLGQGAAELPEADEGDAPQVNAPRVDAPSPNRLAPPPAVPAGEPVIASEPGDLVGDVGAGTTEAAVAPAGRSTAQPVGDVPGFLPLDAEPVASPARAPGDDPGEDSRRARPLDPEAVPAALPGAVDARPGSEPLPAPSSLSEPLPEPVPFSEPVPLSDSLSFPDPSPLSEPLPTPAAGGPAGSATGRPVFEPVPGSRVPDTPARGSEGGEPAETDWRTAAPESSPSRDVEAPLVGPVPDPGLPEPVSMPSSTGLSTGLSNAISDSLVQSLMIDSGLASVEDRGPASPPADATPPGGLSGSTDPAGSSSQGDDEEADDADKSKSGNANREAEEAGWPGSEPLPLPAGIDLAAAALDVSEDLDVKTAIEPLPSADPILEGSLLDGIAAAQVVLAPDLENATGVPGDAAEGASPYRATQPAPIPEPSTLALFALVVAALAARHARRRCRHV